MAMNTSGSRTVTGATALETTTTGRAAASLREHVDQRWVEVADGVLASVLRKHRISHPVGARTAAGGYRVSEIVLKRLLQDALDPVPRCEVEGIRIHVEGETYTGVTLVVTAQFPDRLIPLADVLRERARECLTSVLGAVTPPVAVHAMHVHVENVTVGDPKIGEPPTG